MHRFPNEPPGLVTRRTARGRTFADGHDPAWTAITGFPAGTGSLFGTSRIFGDSHMA